MSPETRERIIQAIIDVESSFEHTRELTGPNVRERALAVRAAVEPLIRADERERCAKAIENIWCGSYAAEVIRANTLEELKKEEPW